MKIELECGHSIDFLCRDQKNLIEFQCKYKCMLSNRKKINNEWYLHWKFIIYTLNIFLKK